MLIKDDNGQAASMTLEDVQYRQLFENSKVVELLVDPADGRIVDANPAACAFYGYERQAFKRMCISEINALDDEAIGQAMAAAERDQVNHFLFRHRLASGALRDVEVHSGAIELWGRRLLYSIIHDVTERVRAEQNLHKLSRALDQSASAVMITNADGIIEYVNQQFCRVTGYNEQEALGQTPHLIYSRQTSDSVLRQLEETVRNGRNWYGELLNRRRNGELYWATYSVSPMLNEAGEVTHFVSVSEDITERRETQLRLEHLAYYDTLTGLANRDRLKECLQQTLQDAQRSGSRLQAALLFIDLDDFKRINDSLGHDAGDALLKAVAQRLQLCAEPEDTLARPGGDEFVLLKRAISGPPEVMQLAGQLLAMLREPLRLDGHEVSVNGSIGIALLPDDGADAGALLKHAELALYRAKEKGCGQYLFYSEEMNAAALDRLLLENQLRQAVEQQQFTLYYQPQIALANQRVCGVEALVRWQDPERGLIPPDQFIPLAEETELIIPLGEWILREACRQARRWQDQGIPPIKVAVNLSISQFRNPRLLEQVELALQDARLEPRWLELELTESMLMDDIDNQQQLLQRLKALGVSLAIDDFGTGYSSLNYLKRLPIDALKVDRTFIKDIPQGRNDKAITAAVIALAHQLGLQVVAEGVETQAQQQFLRLHGCSLAQGYLYSRPLPAQEIATYLKRWAGPAE